MRRFTRLTNAFSKKVENLERRRWPFTSCGTTSGASTRPFALLPRWKLVSRITLGHWTKSWPFCNLPMGIDMGIDRQTTGTLVYTEAETPRGIGFDPPGVWYKPHAGVFHFWGRNGR